MSSEYDRLVEADKAGKGCRQILMKRPIMVAAASLDPLEAAPTSKIPAGTPLAPVPATGFHKPIRRALCTGSCTTGEKVINMTDNTMFQVGDVVGVVAAATPALAAAVAIGTIASKIAATSITLVANAASAVTSGDQIEVMENVTVLTMGDAVILEHSVDLRGADGVAVDRGAVGVIAGQIARANLNYNVSLGITVTRLKEELRMIDLVNTVAGVVT